MPSYTIVAIPSEDDYVWKISSEKIPHMTILNLGSSLSDETHVIDFVQHVVDVSLCRFGMNVDRRDTLGPDEADVLFFDTKYCKQIEDFRANLLKDPIISQAYNTSEQYDEWTPHLTLGYPKTPAKPDNRDYPGINWVNFDKIAVWTDNYSGPEFRLENNLLGDSVAYGDMSLEDALAHFGIKGMRWGVHKQAINGVALADTSVSGLRNDPTKKAAKAKVGESGGLHKVSDKELKAMLNRMDMEKKFDKFMEEDRKRRVEGVKAVGKILGEVGKIVLPIALGVVASRVASNMNAPFRTSAFVSHPVIEG